MSYGGQLHLGLIADRDLVPDLDAMAGYIADELDVLTAAVVPAVEIDVTDHASARRKTKKPVRPAAS
jgi:diacylglycerol O-acyltransferase